MNGSSVPHAAFQGRQISNHRGGREAPFNVITSNLVSVSQLKSSWAKAVEDRLTELTCLPVGWDGYAGRPVSFPCAYFVANMLERLCQDHVPPPSLVPGSDGSLQVEWHRNNFDVELDVLDAQNVLATRVNLLTDEEEVIEIQNDFSGIVGWIKELSDENNPNGQD